MRGKSVIFHIKVVCHGLCVSYQFSIKDLLFAYVKAALGFY
jgi:hypothetical protein